MTRTRSMPFQRTSLGLLLGAAALGVVNLQPSTAHAEIIEGRFQLGLNMSVFSFDHATLEGDGGEMSFSAASVGVLGSNLGVQLGYGVSQRWLIGGRIAMGSATQTIAMDDVLDDVTTTGSSYLLAPRVAYLLSDGEHFKPYLAGTLGLRGQSSSAGADRASEASVTASAFVYGAELGAHLFTSSGMSIDPSLTLLGVSGQQTFGSEPTTEVSHSGFSLTLGVTLSGWMGDGPTRAPSEDGTAAAAESRADEGAEAGTHEDASAAPERPQANTLAFDEDGVLRLDIGLGPGRLRLVGRPAVNGSRVLVQLVPRFDRGECTEARLVSGGSEQRLRFAGRRGTASPTSEFMATAAQLESLSAPDGDATIVLCETNWSLGAREQGYVSKFLSKFRERAVERGTWTEPEPAPAAPEPQAVDAAATP